MNKLLRFLMPKTARRLDEQQRAITKLEQENSYLRLGGGGIVSKHSLIGGATTTVRNSQTTTPSVRNSTNTSPIRSSSSVFDTFTPTSYSDYSSCSSSSCDSSSSSDSGSCCCD